MPAVIGLCGLGTAFIVLSAGCGVTVQSSPHIVPASDVPFGLAAVTTSTSSPESLPKEAIIQVFIVQSGHLVPVDRVINSPLSVSVALSELVSGPTNTEAAFGGTSAIPAGTTIRSVRVSGSTATVDMSQSFVSVGGPSQILAIAQIVYTATQIPPITGVAFELDGAPVEVPAADGTLQDQPVGRSSYAQLAPGIPVTGGGR